jgi:hypothetical protein
LTQHDNKNRRTILQCVCDNCSANVNKKNDSSRNRSTGQSLDRDRFARDQSRPVSQPRSGRLRKCLSYPVLSTEKLVRTKSRRRGKKRWTSHSLIDLNPQFIPRKVKLIFSRRQEYSFVVAH